MPLPSGKLISMLISLGLELRTQYITPLRIVYRIKRIKVNSHSHSGCPCTAACDGPPLSISLLAKAVECFRFSVMHTVLHTLLALGGYGEPPARHGRRVAASKAQVHH
jgi:hypothetical protein